MPFVLFLFFGLWFLLICAKDKGNHIAKASNFTQCRYQEEFLLFYEKFFEYRTDVSRSDPIGDALEDAREELWKRGYLPTSMAHFGRSAWKQRPVLRRQRWTQGMKIRVMPFYADLLRMRVKDRGPGGWSMQADFLERHGKDIVFNEERWNEYCEELDKRFEDLWNCPQVPFDYSIVDRLTEIECNNIVRQGGVVCHHHQEDYWSAEFHGVFLGFGEQAIGDFGSTFSRGNFPHRYNEAASCTYHYETISFEQRKQDHYRLGLTGKKPYQIMMPITLDIEKLNRKWEQEWKQQGMPDTFHRRL